MNSRPRFQSWKGGRHVRSAGAAAIGATAHDSHARSPATRWSEAGERLPKHHPSSCRRCEAGEPKPTATECLSVELPVTSNDREARREVDGDQLHRV